METYNKIKNKFFKIIPENKTVIGEGLKYSIEKEVKANFTREELYILPYDLKLDELVDDDNYVYSKAVCIEDDVFDKQKGIDIASEKLDLKNHLRMVRKYSRALRYMQSAMRKLEDLINKHLKKAYAIRNDLDKYYGGRN